MAGMVITFQNVPFEGGINEFRTFLTYIGSLY